MLLLIYRVARSSPLSAAGEERVVEQSDDRVSQPGGLYRRCISANVRRVDSPRVRYAARPSLPLRGKEGSCTIGNILQKTLSNAIVLVLLSSQEGSHTPLNSFPATR
jgi:hypothetical protein